MRLSILISKAKACHIKETEKSSIKEEGKEEKGEGKGRKWDPGSESMFSAVCSMFANAHHADRWLMSFGFVGAAGNGLSFPILLTIMGKTVNNLGNYPSSPSFNQAINQNSLNFVYLGACTFVACFLEGYCWTRTAERQASRMRMQYLKAVLRQDVGFFDLNFASINEIITNVSSDSFVIQEVLSEKVPNYIMHCSNFIGSYVAAIILLWRLAAGAFPTVALLLIPGLIYGWVSLGLGRKIRMEYDKAGVVAQQAFSAIRTVYSSVAERRTMVAFSAALEGSMRVGLRQGLAKGLALGSNSVTFSIWALIAWYGSRLVIYKGAQGGTVYAVGICIIFGGLAFGSSLSNVKYFGEALAAAERIKKVIDRQPPIDSASEEGEELGQVKGEVEFSKVRFAYPARPEAEVFERFSLRVEAGKTVALVGGSGSGKSTAIALLLRFYDPSGGHIFLDGVDIRKLRLKWLRAQMRLVSQEPALFATTIKENVLFGKVDATMEEVVAAAKASNSHDFITQLPLGYNTQVGERGVQLSGGQKQRIAIARAIIGGPKILLLDEATSALESESECIVQEALDAATIGRTTIVIAHRLSTIRNADTIAFIDAGQITESGSHNQLISNLDGSYTALFRLQESLPPDMNKNSASGRLSRNNCSTCHKLTKSSSARSAGDAGGENDRHVLPTKPLAPSFRRLLMMNAPEWRQAVVCGGAALMIGGVQPVYAYFMGSMVTAYFLKDPDEIKEKAKTHALIFVGLTIFSFVVNVLQHYSLGVLGECLTRRVRERMVSKMLTFEVAWFDREENSTGALCSRIAKDATVVRSLVGDRMSLLIQALGAVILAWTMGLIIAWPLAVVMIAAQPMIIACFYARRIVLIALSRKAIKTQLESSKMAAKAVENLRTVTAFSLQDRIFHLFCIAQAGSRRQSIRQSWLAGVGIGCSYSLTIFTWALSMWYGGHLVSQHNITSKALIQTFMIVATTGRVIADASSTTTDLSKGITSVASVFDFLDRSPSIDPEDPQGHHAETITGAVELRNVDFAYPARPDVIVLKSFSLSIEAGQSTALVGSSGSGKSTIISLIERFYDPLCGVVLVDGRDIRSYSLRSLRQHISLVGQEPTLFASTVRENITYGVEKASNMEIEAAARAANAHEFISVLKDGYETLCGERGVQLSGGQKQRVAIARAILRNPSVLLLDEATSALDGKSEKLVQEALERMMVGRTSVVVAHRLSTIRNCNVIAVLNKGVMAEKGNHESLMSIGPEGIYYGLVILQQAHL